MTNTTSWGPGEYYSAFADALAILNFVAVAAGAIGFTYLTLTFLQGMLVPALYRWWFKQLKWVVLVSIAFVAAYVGFRRYDMDLRLFVDAALAVLLLLGWICVHYLGEQVRAHRLLQVVHEGRRYTVHLRKRSYTGVVIDISAGVIHMRLGSGAFAWIPTIRAPVIESLPRKGGAGVFSAQ